MLHNVKVKNIPKFFCLLILKLDQFIHLHCILLNAEQIVMMLIRNNRKLGGGLASGDGPRQEI